MKLHAILDLSSEEFRRTVQQLSSSSISKLKVDRELDTLVLGDSVALNVIEGIDDIINILNSNTGTIQSSGMKYVNDVTITEMLKEFDLDEEFNVVSVSEENETDIALLVFKIGSLTNNHMPGAEMHITLNENKEMLHIDGFPLNRAGFLASYGLYVGR
jgi:hypothetical protein